MWPERQRIVWPFLSQNATRVEEDANQGPESASEDHWFLRAFCNGRSIPRSPPRPPFPLPRGSQGRGGREKVGHGEGVLIFQIELLVERHRQWVLPVPGQIGWRHRLL